MKIEITTNATDARHFYDSLARSQLPFAISRSINKLAWDIRDGEQSKLDKYFDTRTSWLTKRGAMPVIRSDKRQAPDIHAIIGVKDEVAAMNITGGTKDAQSGDMAVPFSDAGDSLSARAILNPGRETLPKSKWPSKIVKKIDPTEKRRKSRRGKPKPFYLKSKAGERFVVLRSSASSQTLIFLYQFMDKVNIDIKWPLDKNARQFIGRNYDDYLTKEIAKAIKSARF